jgi:hypothetical protein
MERNMSKWTLEELEGCDTQGVLVMLNEYQDMVDKLSTYTHRNGESTPPEVEGWYWIEDGGNPFIDLLAYKHDEWEWMGEFTHISPTATYYGPIPVPKGVTST